MKKIYPSIAARLEFIVEDADGLPVPSLTHADVSSAGYRNRQYGVKSSTTSVSLTSSVADTAAVAAGQFVTIESSRGHYAIDCPSGAAGAALDYAEAVVVFTAGHVVTPSRHEIDLNLQYATSNVATLSAISGRIPAALVSGRMDASVGAMAANTLTASALAADAATEIAAAADDTILAAIAAEAIKTAAIKAKTDSLTFTVPGKVDATAELDSASQQKLNNCWKYGDVIEFSDADSGEVESHRITTSKIS